MAQTISLVTSMGAGRSNQPPGELMTLREQRVLFTSLLCELVGWIESLGYDVAFDEGTVHSPRKGRTKTNVLLEVEDAVHVKESFHHQGLAMDLLVYTQEGTYISNGKDPLWMQIAIRWEGMHPLCTSGIRWSDANHVSFGEGSKETPLSASK